MKVVKYLQLIWNGLENGEYKFIFFQLKNIMKNGSLILFSSNDIPGCIIKCFSSANCIPNNLKLTHAGILFKASEKKLYELTQKNYYCKDSEIE